MLVGVSFPCHAQEIPAADAASERRRTELERTLETLGSDPSLAPVVERALTDDDPALRLAAVGAILSHVAPASFSVGPDWCLSGDFAGLPAHLALLADAVDGRLHDVDAKVRAAAITAVTGRELMPARVRAACVAGARGAMTVVMAPEGYLTERSVRRLESLIADPDPDVRGTAVQALLMGAPVDAAYVDLIFEAAKGLDEAARGGWYVGIERVRADVDTAAAVVERLAAAPPTMRGHGCKYIGSWEADERILHSLLLWHAQESDATTRTCLQATIGRHQQRLAYLKANAPALARVRALEVLVKGVEDAAQAAPQVREALRDPDALVRAAGLRFVVDWTIGQSEFDKDTPGSFAGDGMPAMHTITLDDFESEITALLDDPEPRLQGIAMELFSKVDILRKLEPLLDRAGPGDLIEMPTLSARVVRRFAKVPNTAPPFVRQIVDRVLLRYAPVDAGHVDRLLEGLTSADAEVVEEAVSNVYRLEADQALLTSFTNRMGRLPAAARRQAVRAVAGLMVEGEDHARLEAWANAEAGTDVGRDI
ncbi:MAG TPA: hypothetical protein VMF13_22315, partial [Luteitalea sp.]|nr:hypothetical protein [Luteitalea sp.]